MKNGELGANLTPLFISKALLDRFLDRFAARSLRRISHEPRGAHVVALRHDVISVEDAPRLVAADLHSDPLRDARVDHAPDGRPSEVMA